MIVFATAFLVLSAQDAQPVQPGQPQSDQSAPSTAVWRTITFVFGSACSAAA